MNPSPCRAPCDPPAVRLAAYRKLRVAVAASRFPSAHPVAPHALHPHSTQHEFGVKRNMDSRGLQGQRWLSQAIGAAVLHRP